MMPKPGKHKSAFVYALQVWGTSLLVGPCIWLLVIGIDSRAILDNFYVFLMLTVYALMYSWPCFLFLWLEVHAIKEQDWRVRTKKVVTALVSLLLTYLLMRVVMAIFGAPNDSFFNYVAGAYSVPLVAAVFWYRWPVGEEEREAGEEMV